MGKDEIEVFVEGATNYFATVTDQSARVGNPYLVDDLRDSVLDYSGVIGINIAYQGNVIFTASKEMVKGLLRHFPESTCSDDLLLDLVGEIANTVAGNARREFGSSFGITPPKLKRGLIEDLQTAKGLQTYCIPIVWQQYRANLIVAMI